MSTPGSVGGKVLLLVPARGGSRGIPGKNLQSVDGASLVGRAVISARRFLREAALPDARIVVDTDSADIATEGKLWGAEVPFERPAELAQDTTTTLASTLHLVDRLTQAGWAPDTIILLQPTSPLRSWRDIADCWSAFVTADHESVITVVEPGKPPQLAMRVNEKGLLQWLGSAPPANVRRQDLPRALSPSGAVYITMVPALRERSAFVVPGVTASVERNSFQSLDVDTPADLVAARRAAELVAAQRPTVLATTAELPVPGGVVTLNDGRVLQVYEAGALHGAMAEYMGEGGVLLVPGEGANSAAASQPGPFTWREALGTHVALWCSTSHQLGAHAMSLGAYDSLVFPEGSSEIASLARAILDGSSTLRS